MIFLLNLIEELLMKFRKKPWARFTINGIQEDGQVKFVIAYNKAFIKNLQQNGFGASSTDETIQNFLFGSLMYPSIYENEVASDEHPFLQSETNILKK